MSDKKLYPFFCSWSGGKDSCLALYRTLQQGNHCKSLFTMCAENRSHSRSHNIPVTVLEAQADALGIPIVLNQATWDDYEGAYRKSGRLFVEHGIDHGVFGDIDLEPHREWVERVCAEVSIIPHLPLWKEDRKDLVIELIQAGFKAKIIVVKEERLATDFLGCDITLELIEKLENAGVDVCGEEGEYHTFVYDGPIFSHPVVHSQSDVVVNNGYGFIEMQL